MGDTCRLQVVEQVPEGPGAQAVPEVDRHRARVHVVQEVDVQGLHHRLHRAAGRLDALAEPAHQLGLNGHAAGVDHPPVRVLGDPRRILLAPAGHEQGQATGGRLGQQVDGPVQGAVGVGRLGAGGRHAAQVGEGVPEPGTSVFEGRAHGGVLGRSVSRGDAQDEATRGQDVHAGRSLGDVGGVSQREHDARHAEGDALRLARQQPEVHPRVEHLPSIAEGGDVEGHVPQPHGGEPEGVRLADPVEVVDHRRRALVRVRLDRNDQTDGQPAWAKHLGVATVEGRERGGVDHSGLLAPEGMETLPAGRPRRREDTFNKTLRMPCGSPT